MGIYIKGIDMPKNNGRVKLDIIINSDGTIDKHIGFGDYNLSKLKAVEVPEPHGRLIDADIFEFIPLKEDEAKGRIIGYLLTKERIDQAPTVIERSETEE